MLPLIDRAPTVNEIEQLRLILSTYQDGSGMLNRQHETEPETLPGWRDFERATALAFGGLAIESKWIILKRPMHFGVQIFFRLSHYPKRYGRERKKQSYIFQNYGQKQSHNCAVSKIEASCQLHSTK